MSHPHSAALQTALYARFTSNTSLTTLLSGAIYDTAPPGAPPALYLLLGEESVRDVSATGGPLSEHEVKLSVVATSGGFSSAKLVSAAVYAALEAPLSIGAQSVKALFLRAEAKVLSGGAVRRIDLAYRLTLG